MAKKYHKYVNNKKIIKLFDHEPPEGWIKGSGPHSPKQKTNHQKAMKQFRGQSKTTEQKEKMSISHLGKTFTPEHRNNISQKIMEYQQKIRDIMNEQKHLSYSEARKLVKETL